MGDSRRGEGPDLRGVAILLGAAVWGLIIWRALA